MKIKILKYLFLLCSLILFEGCIKEAPIIIEGMQPVYLPVDSYELIKTGPPRPSNRQGKVVVYENLILISENLEGIHVIDNSDPNNPVKIAFWEIPGNSNFTIDKNVLYADNGLYLLVIDVSDVQHIVFESVVEGHLTSTGDFEVFPPNYNGWFQCAAIGKGIVIGWERATLTDPKCVRW